MVRSHPKGFLQLPPTPCFRLKMLIFGERAFLRASVTNGSTEPAEEEEEGRLQLELPPAPCHGLVSLGNELPLLWGSPEIAATRENS